MSLMADTIRRTTHTFLEFLLHDTTDTTTVTMVDIPVNIMADILVTILGVRFPEGPPMENTFPWVVQSK